MAGRFLFCLCRINGHLLKSPNNRNVLVNEVRGMKRWRRAFYASLYKRRIEQGPEPDRHRSVWPNWNYDSEIYSFGQRLRENFKESTLKTAFTHKSYVDNEKDKRREMEIEGEVELDIEDNTTLIMKGEELSINYIKAYLRHSFPALPEEGICAVCDYLMADEMLAEIGINIGMKDLILCAEFPPTTETLSQCLKAVIGGLAEDQGVERAQYFVQDFVLSMLVSKDIMEIWQLVNPMGVLQAIVSQQQRGDVESRLLFETGPSTVLAAYMVGVYNDKKLLGKGYGETVTIAEEMAARDALRQHFGTTISRAPLPFGNEGHKLEINHTRINASVTDYLSPSQLQ